MCRLELLEWQILFHYLIPKVYSDATTATSPAGIRNKDWNISSAIVLENHTFLLSLSPIFYYFNLFFRPLVSFYLVAMPDGDAWGACSLARTSTPGLTSIRRQTSQICICIFNCIVLFINMCICMCLWSKQLYIYPQTGKQPCKDVHSRSSSILGQTSPNQLEFQTGLAFNLLPASAFSVHFFLDFKSRKDNFRKYPTI